MPKITHSRETEIRRAIRDAKAIDPLMSLVKVMDFLKAKFNHDFHHQYISRLLKKVHAEATPDLDREKVVDRLRKVRETMRIGQENLLRIAYGEGNRPVAVRDRIAAWRAIALLEKLQLDAELDLRIFDKGLGPADPDMFRSRPIPPEIREAMVRTAQLWRLPTDLTRKIEHREAVDVDYKESNQRGATDATAANVAPAKANESANSQSPSGILADPELQLS